MDDIILNNDDTSSGEPLEAAAGMEDMDPESRMMLKEELEEKLKAGKKLSEEEMDLAEELMGEDILKYLDAHKDASPVPKNPLPEEEEEKLEEDLLRKALADKKEPTEEQVEEELRRIAEGKN
jgi:hypothetical protein